jgi:hypothetical protein
MTMTLVSTVTVGSGGAASIDFTSIPQTGTDLVLLLSGRSTAGSGNDIATQITLNGVTTSSYSYRALYGTGSSAFSDSSSGQTEIQSARINDTSSTSNTFGNYQIYIPNYTSTTNKSLSFDAVTENNATATYGHLVAASFTTSSPITSLAIKIAGGNSFAIGSTASLYTIKNGSGGASVA